jgi:hypothetical protein
MLHELHMERLSFLALLMHKIRGESTQHAEG